MASDEAVRLPGAPPAGSAEPACRFLSPHQAAVLEAATRRLVPAPDIDPQKHVVAFVDCLLSVFDVTHAEGPVRQRVTDLRDQYTRGIALLDQQAGGDFTAIPRLCQELIMSRSQVAPFASLLFDHIVEAIYAAPRCSGKLPRNRPESPTRRTRAFR